MTGVVDLHYLDGSKWERGLRSITDSEICPHEEEGGR